MSSYAVAEGPPIVIYLRNVPIATSSRPTPALSTVTGNETVVITWLPLCASRRPDEERKLHVIGIIQIVFAALSFCGAMSIIAYTIAKRIVTSSEVRPLFHLSLADIGLALFLILSSTLWTYSKHIDGHSLCVVFQALTEVFYITTFLLTVNYALNVYVKLKDKHHLANNLTPLKEQQNVRRFLRSVYVISWILPLMLMLPGFIATYTTSPDPCIVCSSLFFRSSERRIPGQNSYRPWDNYGSVLFVASLTFSLFSITVLYLLATSVYKSLIRSQNEWTDRQRNSVKALRLRVTLYIMVFIICWSPALVLALIEISKQKTLSVTDYFPLYIMQSITAPSQGLLNCFIYGWSRHSILNRTDAPIRNRTYRFYSTTSAGPRKFAKEPKHSESTSEGSQTI